MISKPIPAKEVPSQMIVFPSKPEKNTNGRPLPLVTNYFPFKQWSLTQVQYFKYAIEITPDFPSDNIKGRKRLMFSIKDELQKKYGDFIFRNTVLYCLKEWIDSEETFSAFYESKDENKEIIATPYQVTIKFASSVNSNSESMPMHKNFFFSLIGSMGYVKFKNSYFNKKNIGKMTSIELWPGFDPTINIYSDQVLLNLNPLTKVIRCDTAYTVLKAMQSTSRPEHFKEDANELFNNISVLTRYNNEKTFQVLGVDFEQTPESKFNTGLEIVTYSGYFLNKYKVATKDKGQPLLICRDPLSKRAKTEEQKKKQEIRLIPEMCFMTGLTEAMRNDFNLMKKVSEFTWGNANDKMKECIKQIEDIVNDPINQKKIKSWNLSISPEPIKVDAIQIPPGNMVLGNNFSFPVDNQNEIDRKVQTKMFETPAITKWAIFVHKNVREVFNKSFIPQFQQSLSTFKYEIQQPNIVEIQGYQWSDWQYHIQNAMSPEVTFALLILNGPKNKGKYYEEIKTYFSCNLKISCQVLLESTMKKDRGLRSVINKILIQMNAKNNGVPWVMNNVPCNAKPTMIFSYIEYKKILSSVSTFNHNFTKYHSKAAFVEDQWKIKEMICSQLQSHMEYFKRSNKVGPNHIIILRDGLNPGRKDIAVGEIKAIKDMLEPFSKTMEVTDGIKFTYVFINKKHNLKCVTMESGNRFGNIPSGAWIDHTLTRNDYEFFLVSQKPGQGISKATQYSVFYDSIENKACDLHTWVYKMCYLYYNWTGSIKVPAITYYAKKLAFLVGDKLCSKGRKNIPSDDIKGLYYI